MIKRKRIIFWLFVVLTIFMCVWSLCIGRYNVNEIDALKEIFNYYFVSGAKMSTEAKVLLYIRIPRTLAAILVGGSLSLAGMTFQSIFRNRLASPDLLGVSTGSCVGASICIIAGYSAIQIQIWAFIGGIITVIVTYLVAGLFKSEKSFALILSGVLIGGIMTSILGFIKYSANKETELPSIVYWTMGDLSSISLQQLSYVIIPIVVCMIILCAISWRINFFIVNDETALSMGVNIYFLKVICIITATILTASSISVAGTIGWVGLSMPQLVRLVCGENTVYSIRVSIFAGMSFLLFADIIGRIISPAEIPMSVLTGIPGVLIFILCLYLSNRREKINA